jgi:hypothetical protein
MAPQRATTTLGLTPIEAPPLATVQALVPSRRSREFARRRERLTDELQLQELTIAATQAKARFALASLQQIHVQAAATFDSAVGQITGITERPGRSSKAHQAYVDEFSARNVSMLGNHFQGVLGIAGRAIAETVALPLYPDPEPPKRGLLARLTGQ